MDQYAFDGSIGFLLARKATPGMAGPVVSALIFGLNQIDLIVCDVELFNPEFSSISRPSNKSKLPDRVFFFERKCDH